MSSGRDSPHLLLLGTGQDGGIPQTGCQKACCREAWSDPTRRRRVTALGIVEPTSRRAWLVDATPDIGLQLHDLLTADSTNNPLSLAGILLTHIHMGHYTGLAQLGPEAMNVRNLHLHTMPRCRAFLESSLPWRRLIENGHLLPHLLQAGLPLELEANLTITPIEVPHRDEDSETIGFRVNGPSRSVLYIPDIDDWDRAHFDLDAALTGVDIAYLDGTFYDEGELSGRPLSEVPHPTICHTMKRLDLLPHNQRGRIRFLHFNHTNPVHQTGSAEADAVRKAGFSLAEEGEIVSL